MDSDALTSPSLMTGSQDAVVFSFVAFCASVTPLAALVVSMRMWFLAAWFGVGLAVVALVLNILALRRARRSRDTPATLMAVTGLAASFAGALLCALWLACIASLVAVIAPGCSALTGC